MSGLSTGLSASERDRFLNAVGLDRFSFVLREQSGPLILDARRHTPPESVPLLDPWLPPTPPLDDERETIIRILHPDGHLHERWAHAEESSLWEALFPYPISEAGPGKFQNSAHYWFIQPYKVESALSGLWNAFHNLEVAMKERGGTSCLQICNPTAALWIVAHHVRNRRLALQIVDSSKISAPLMTTISVEWKLCLEEQIVAITKGCERGALPPSLPNPYPANQNPGSQMKL